MKAVNNKAKKNKQTKSKQTSQFPYKQIWINNNKDDMSFKKEGKENETREEERVWKKVGDGRYREWVGS